MLAQCLDLALDVIADIDSLIGVAGRLREEVALANIVRLEALVAVLRVVEREVREHRCLGRCPGYRPVVLVVLVRRVRVPREEHVRLMPSYRPHALLPQLVKRRLAKSPVLVAEELDLRIDAQHLRSTPRLFPPGVRRERRAPVRLQRLS